MATSESCDLTSAIPDVNRNMDFEQVQMVLDDNVPFISSIVEKLNNDEDTTGSLQEFYNNHDDIIKRKDQIPVDDVAKVETASTSMRQSSPLRDYPHTTDTASKTDDNKYDEVISLDMESLTATYKKVTNNGETIIPPLVTMDSGDNNIARETEEPLLDRPDHEEHISKSPKQIAKVYPTVQVPAGFEPMQRFRGMDRTPQQTFYQPRPRLMPHFFNQQPPMMTFNRHPPFFYGNPWYKPITYNLLNPPQQAQMENSRIQVPLPVIQRVSIPHAPLVRARSSVSPLLLPTATVYPPPYINSSMRTFPGNRDPFR